MVQQKDSFDPLTDQQRRDWEAAHNELSARKAAARGTDWPSVRLSAGDADPEPTTVAADAAQPVVKRRKIGGRAESRQQADQPKSAGRRCAQTDLHLPKQLCTKSTVHEPASHTPVS